MVFLLVMIMLKILLKITLIMKRSLFLTMTVYRSNFPDLAVYFRNRSDSIRDCNRIWTLDSYNKQKIKDFKRTNLCKDKFCNNCKKVIQASRMSNYIPEIEKYKNIYSLYHVVLTVPNCSGKELQDIIKNMFKSYRYLTQYFRLNKKIKGLDFGSFGYVGSIRSLEITFNGDNYHPHLHCIFALSNSYSLDKIFTNSFSYNNNVFSRYFSFLEILVQKIWYLLNNNIRVTLDNLDNIELGYSCTFDNIEDSSYYEVFKYMTKSKDDSESVLTYENFKTLFFSLYRVRQIQGYGIFYNFKEDDNIDFEVDEYYDFIVEYLQKKESPIEIFETPQDSLKDDFLLISRKKIYSYLKNL
ncbi:hypothetical protein C4R89_00905 [Clostridioides difficile]|nr:hypothetical protein [Clostridioides difficile]